MSAMDAEHAAMQAGSSCGASFGQRLFGACAGIFFLGMNVLLCMMAIGEAPVALAIVVVLCPIGYGLLQAGFHTRVEWSPRGVVFRRVWVTWTLPWPAVTTFDASGAGACVLASRPDRALGSISSPDIQIIRTDVLGDRPSPVTRTAQLLNDYRANMPAAALGTPITTTPTRPGVLAIVWLAAQVVLLCASAVLVAID